MSVKNYFVPSELQYCHSLGQNHTVSTESDSNLRYLGVLGDKCTNFTKWLLFRIFISILFSPHQDIIGYPYE